MNISINRYLDAAVLVPGTTRNEAVTAIETCLKLNTYSVCVRPCDIELAQSMCNGTETAVCVVLAFPHGVALTSSKVDEARRYVDLGVAEIDMVSNYGWAASGMWDAFRKDVSEVAAVTKSANVALKVIFETSQLEDETIAPMVERCIEAGADFVKTSTGFNGEGAQDRHVKLMLETAKGRIKVKPSGGIRDRERAEKLIRMGAHRLGVNWAACTTICTGRPGASIAGSY